MTELEKLIQTEIKNDNPDFFTLLELYSEHPSSKRNIVITCEQRFRHGEQQAKLVYECEKLIGEKKFSGKRAIIHAIPKKGIKIVKETKIEVPENYEYTVKYDDLPEDLKKLVIEKGSLYSEMDLIKKELNAVGPKNDDSSIKKRKEIRERIEEISNKIKAIHKLLVKYDSTKEYDLSELEEKIEGDPQWTDESLIEEYKINENSWEANKLLLKNLQSLVPKQLERAKTSAKEDTKKKNAEEAVKGLAVIELLKKYFEENPEAKGE